MTEMKQNRFTEDQIIGFLKEAQAGLPVKELCRRGGFRCNVLSMAIQIWRDGGIGGQTA